MDGLTRPAGRAVPPVGGGASSGAVAAAGTDAAPVAEGGAVRVLAADASADAGPARPFLENAVRQNVVPGRAVPEKAVPRRAVLHAVVPADIDDPARPSGGNRYDRRVLDALAGHGWMVRERAVAGSWPVPTPPDVTGVDRVLRGLPDGSLVLIDGLIASAVARMVIPQTARLRVVVLLHMPLGSDGERELLRRCAAVVTSSRWVGDRLRSAGMHPDRLIVAEPGVDPAASTAGTSAGGRLLSVAVLAPHKGQDLLIAALHRLTDLDWTCTVAGSPDVDSAFAARLRADAAGLGDRIRFVGPLTGADLDGAYAFADLLVHPSRAETYGMVITEALARAIPVVATDVGGIPGALGRDAAGDRPGCLVAADDADALAAALRGWLTDPGRRVDWRRAALARRGTLAGWSTTAELLDHALAGAR